MCRKDAPDAPDRTDSPKLPALCRVIPPLPVHFRIERRTGLGMMHQTMPLTASPSSAMQMELGFAVSHQVIPIPGRTDLFQVRTSVTPRTGDALLSVADVAERLRISPRSACRLLASGAIRSHRPGLRRRRVYQRDLDSYCRSQGIG
ncbi:MAG: DNA-binding protein [Verrucomicrobiaceae bacterium]|nr:MAG: DNA-binding protein [Verrucomicrobiaceae bacterium]